MRRKIATILSLLPAFGLVLGGSFFTNASLMASVAGGAGGAAPVPGGDAAAAAAAAVKAEYDRLSAAADGKFDVGQAQGQIIHGLLFKTENNNNPIKNGCTTIVLDLAPLEDIKLTPTLMVRCEDKWEGVFGKNNVTKTINLIILNTDNKWRALEKSVLRQLNISNFQLFGKIMCGPNLFKEGKEIKKISIGKNVVFQAKTFNAKCSDYTIPPESTLPGNLAQKLLNPNGSVHLRAFEKTLSERWITPNNAALKTAISRFKFNLRTQGFVQAELELTQKTMTPENQLSLMNNGLEDLFDQLTLNIEDGCSWKAIKESEMPIVLKIRDQNEEEVFSTAAKADNWNIWSFLNKPGKLNIVAMHVKNVINTVGNGFHKKKIANCLRQLCIETSEGFMLDSCIFDYFPNLSNLEIYSKSKKTTNNLIWKKSSLKLERQAPDGKNFDPRYVTEDGIKIIPSTQLRSIEVYNLNTKFDNCEFSIAKGGLDVLALRLADDQAQKQLPIYPHEDDKIKNDDGTASHLLRIKNLAIFDAFGNSVVDHVEKKEGIFSSSKVSYTQLRPWLTSSNLQINHLVLVGNEKLVNNQKQPKPKVDFGLFAPLNVPNISYIEGMEEVESTPQTIPANLAQNEGFLQTFKKGVASALSSVANKVDSSAAPAPAAPAEGAKFIVRPWFSPMTRRVKLCLKSPQYLDRYSFILNTSQEKSIQKEKDGAMKEIAKRVFLLEFSGDGGIEINLQDFPNVDWLTMPFIYTLTHAGSIRGLTVKVFKNNGAPYYHDFNLNLPDGFNPENTYLQIDCSNMDAKSTLGPNWTDPRAHSYIFPNQGSLGKNVFEKHGDKTPGVLVSSDTTVPLTQIHKTIMHNQEASR